jgi:hypothetical protein
MSEPIDPVKFLQRWSRLKRDAADSTRQQDNAAPPPETNEASAAPAAGEQDAAPHADAFDPAALPSLESIDANTDVRDFLKAGVPAELTRAALRRAWSADPAIRDFVGLVENGWDFNAADAMPGFGSVSAEEVARLLAQVAGESPQQAGGPAAKPTQPAPPPVGCDENAPLQSKPPPQSAQNRLAVQQGAASSKAADVQGGENDAPQNRSGSQETPPKV